MNAPPSQLFSGMIDLHCHLLPGIDDGARTMKQALAMAEIAVQDGITLAVMTPHHLNGVYDNPADDIRQQVRDFSEALVARDISLEILPGAECHLVPELPAALADKTAMTVADRGDAVLVELPVHTIPMGATTILEEIRTLGMTPVIVHPERNSQLRKQPERLADWVAMGCLAQATAQACTGRFGEPVRQAARHMVTSGLIHFVASDAHRDRRRVPQMSPGRQAIADWTSDEVAHLLSEVNPRALVAGRPIETQRLHDAIDCVRPSASLWQRVRNVIGLETT